MTRKKKILIGLAVSVSVLVLALTCLVLFWLGPTVKAVVRLVVPKALGTPVAIERLHISPRHGTVELTGFILSNQDGFGRDNAVSLGRLEISMDLSSIFTSTVVVHNVEIERPDLTYEQSHATDNILAFIQDFEEFANIDIRARLEERRQRDPEQSASDVLKVVIIESMTISDVVFHLANSVDSMLDMEVRVDELHTSMTNGITTISGFSISNPSRLKTPHLFALDRVEVRLAPESIYSDVVLVKEVSVERPWFYLEKNQETDTGAELMKIVDSFSKRLAAAPPPEVLEEMVRDAMEVPEEGLPARLDRLSIDDVAIHLSDYTQGDEAATPARLFEIERVEVDPLEGKVLVGDIMVRNPAGFTSENIFELQSVEVAFDPDTVLSEQVQILNVDVRSPRVSLEQTERGGNVAELRALVMDLIPPEVAPLVAPPGPTGPAAPALDLENQPVALNLLSVTNLVVDLVVPEEDHADERIDEQGRLTIMAFDLLRVWPLEGRVDIQQLTVANPLGFANPHLVTIQQFVLDVDVETITAETLYVEDVIIQRPLIAYERKIRTDNIKALQEEIERKLESREQNQRTAEEARGLEHPPEPEQQKIAIGHFLMRKGLVKVKLSILPSAPIPLPTIELNNIGKRDQGADVRDALTEIGTTVYAAILGSVSSSTGYASCTVRNAALVAIAMHIAAPPVVMADGEHVPVDNELIKDSESSESNKRTRRGAGGRRRF